MEKTCFPARKVEYRSISNYPYSTCRTFSPPATWRRRISSPPCSHRRSRKRLLPPDFLESWKNLFELLYVCFSFPFFSFLPFRQFPLRATVWKSVVGPAETKCSSNPCYTILQKPSKITVRHPSNLDNVPSHGEQIFLAEVRPKDAKIWGKTEGNLLRDLFTEAHRTVQAINFPFPLRLLPLFNAVEKFPRAEKRRKRMNGGLFSLGKI